MITRQQNISDAECSGTPVLISGLIFNKDLIKCLLALRNAQIGKQVHIAQKCDVAKWFTFFTLFQFSFWFRIDKKLHFRLVTLCFFWKIAMGILY